MAEVVHEEELGHLSLADAYRRIDALARGDEEVEIADFPHVINWSYIKLGEDGEMQGISGPQEFVLMSNGLLKGLPPWLEEDSDDVPDKSSGEK